MTRRPAPPAAALGLALFLLAGAPAPAAGDAPETSPRPDVGQVDFPSSATGEARDRFLRGVAALHSFWYDEARAEFRAARAADPGFALAYWGEAMTHNHPIWDQVETDEGRAVLEALGATPEERAARAPTERERAWLAAVEILFYGDGEKEARDAAYEAAMARLAERWPDDLEAAAFHALAIEGVVYGGVPEARRFPLLMQAAARLEELHDRAPDHPGVLHYLIHAYDDPTHAPLGLRAARTYARVAPAAPHALHMPSHIFVQLGRWDEATASNQDAWRASVDWVERRDLAPRQQDFHSLSWLLYAQLQQGRVAAARETLGVARREAARDAGIAPHLASMEARFGVETGGEVPLSADGEDEHEGHGHGRHHAYAERATLLAAAISAAERSDAETARRAADRLSALAADADATGPVRVMAAQAAALVLLAEAPGRPSPRALELLAEAARLEEASPPPSGPPDTQVPPHEMYGLALLEAGDPAAAAEQLEIALARTPRRPAALLGAARAAAALGDSEAARERYRTLAEIWHAADPDLPALAEVRRGAAAAEAVARQER